MSSLPLSSQSTSLFTISPNNTITISSQFDSGNIKVLKQMQSQPTNFYLSSVSDNQTSQHQSNTRSWFHFSVLATTSLKCKFNIQKIQCFYQLMEGKSYITDVYRPVVKENGKWGRLKTECVLRKNDNDVVDVGFEYKFEPGKIVYFAFCYPWSYQENSEYIQRLDQMYLNGKDFQYHSEVIIKSPQSRDIHLLTITSHSDQAISLQPIFNQNLFPFKNRPKMFNKPVVLISARVHPGETPSSYSMMGMVNFLTSSDLRAVILRQMFVFMIVPMINVDGVSRGNFRMDAFGQNLNRYYLDPDIQKQPAPYAIKKLAQNLNENKRLSFYFDLHAHNSKKGCFMYGNAIDNFIDQVESNTFCKLISMNTPFFQYNYCTFSTKHMKIKDRFEDLTKEGCARVVMHKLTGIIHSYCLESGVISSSYLNQLNPPSNKQFQLNENKLIQHPTLIQQSDKIPLCTIQMYQDIGKAVMISILDTFDKNPYSRINNTSNPNQSLSSLRREIAFQVFHDAERFRMFEKSLFSKVRDINQLMMSNFKGKFSSKIFDVQYSQIFKEVNFPQSIQGLQKEGKGQTLNSLDKSFGKSMRISKQTLNRFMQTKKNVKPIYKSFKEEQLTSTAIQSSNTLIDDFQSLAEPTNPVVSPKDTIFSLIKQSSHRKTEVGLLKNIIEEPIRYPSITEESKRRPPITVELKTKIFTSVKEELKSQLKNQMIGFSNHTEYKDNKSEQKTYIIFNKQEQKCKSAMYYLRERKTVSQRVTNMKRNTPSNNKKQKRITNQGDDSDSYLLMNIHHSVGKFYKQIQNTINSEREKHVLLKQHYSQIINNNKLSDSLNKMRVAGNIGGYKRQFKLPRLPEDVMIKSELFGGEKETGGEQKRLHQSSIVVSDFGTVDNKRHGKREKKKRR